ncbi:hypothetical protein WJX84_008475, partial [Apatococcus fuscideae]
MITKGDLSHTIVIAAPTIPSGTDLVARGHRNGAADPKAGVSLAAPANGRAVELARVKKLEERLVRQIPGYENMSAAQQLKARTRAMLQQNRQQGGSASGEPWTRYVFSQDALLEEEGAVPEDAGSNGSEGPDGISLHAMPHQARAAPAGLDSHAAHE